MPSIIPVYKWIDGSASRGRGEALQFTIATIVNDLAQYEEMLASFAEGGFIDNCEFIGVDNRNGNQFDGYSGIRLLLAQARGRYVIVCHQDVRLINDNRATLEARLHDLEKVDPFWALAGNAGGTEDDLAIRISDPHGEDQRRGELPSRVSSLDENFILVKAEAMIAPSADLRGFHLYGTDLCLQASMRGHTAYVIDFHLRHLGRGTVGRDYYACLEALEDKYSALMKTHRIRTTCLAPVMTPSPLRLAFARLLRLRKKLKKLKIERLAQVQAPRV